MESKDKVSSVVVTTNSKKLIYTVARVTSFDKEATVEKVRLVNGNAYDTHAVPLAKKISSALLENLS